MIYGVPMQERGMYEIMAAALAHGSWRQWQENV